MKRPSDNRLLLRHTEHSPSAPRVSKQPMPLFYRIYGTLLAVFAVALAIGAFGLHAWLKQYNEGIPETVSQHFFEQYFEQHDAAGILSYTTLTPSEFETVEQLTSHITDLLRANPLTYTSIASGSDANVKKYIVKSGEFKIADFTLEKNAQKGWEPTSVRLHLPNSEKKIYRICNSSTLYLNDIAVSDTYIVSQEPFPAAAFLPESVSAPAWVTYEIPNLTAVPEARLMDRNGNAPALLEQDGIFCEDLIYDTPEPALTEYLVKAAKQYATCMQNDASKASVLKYFEKGTDLYNSIRSADNMFVWSHSGYEFKDESVSEFFRYDENTVSVRIAFTHILHRAGSVDYKDKTDITYFAHKTANTDDYLIFARYNN